MCIAKFEQTSLRNSLMFSKNNHSSFSCFFYYIDFRPVTKFVRQPNVTLSLDVSLYNKFNKYGERKYKKALYRVFYL